MDLASSATRSTFSPHLTQSFTSKTSSRDSSQDRLSSQAGVWPHPINQTSTHHINQTMALKSLVSRLGLLLLMATRSLPTTASTHEVSASDDGMLSLSEALKYAQPGDTISLADGIYDTALESYMDGEDGSPITIEGSSDAIINGKNDDSRSVLINNSFITLRVSPTYFHPSVQSRRRYHKELKRQSLALFPYRS